MAETGDEWARKTFRVTWLPNYVNSFDDVASLLSSGLGEMLPKETIRVYSLALSLNRWEPLGSKEATVMFGKTPSLVTNSPKDKEWHHRDINLDLNFQGMTVLNDAHSDHQFDCIVISGLASHPFGSWQPKEGDKTFMWIRDELRLPGVRTIIHGYDTKLERSQSFKKISDLAKSLIVQLRTYGWGLPNAKPIMFLAHSLGGLVVRDAMVQLEQSPAKKDGAILALLRGAVFFGVPNRGMEQSYFQTIVDNNPNADLVEDIGRQSNYLSELNNSFSQGSFQSRVRFFWAYETEKSPTLRRRADGKLDRSGVLAILVSRESATCRYIDTDPSITIPIDENHSEMVKFRRGSRYIHIVLDCLQSISEIAFNEHHDTFHESQDRSSFVSSDGRVITGREPSPGESNAPIAVKARRTDMKVFDQELLRVATSFTDDEQLAFQATTFDSLREFITNLQQQHERDGNLMYMKRLEWFLTMKDYIELVESLQLFEKPSRVSAYLWGPMKYILESVQEFPDAFHAVLDAYQDIGEQLPIFRGRKQLFESQSYLEDVLITLYQEILGFHHQTIQYFKHKNWQAIFKASWRASDISIKQVVKAFGSHHKPLVENGASIADFSAMKRVYQDSYDASKKIIGDRDDLHRDIVYAWLCPFDNEIQHKAHQKTRSICKDPGRWLINNDRFQGWLSPDYCSTPLLWLNGKPGAGKTILTSVVIDEVRRTAMSTLAFFYCKHEDKLRSTFIGVARSILAQVLSQTPHLLPCFHDRAYLNRESVLSSPDIAYEMLETVLNSCDRTYIIIDGLDECAKDERQQITSRILKILDGLDETNRDSVRCLLVSQDDGISQRSLGHLTSLTIATENKKDLKSCAAVWHKRIESMHGTLRTPGTNLTNIITARAQGMFIFAEALASYLESLPSRAALLEELNPERLPVQLDDLYRRILDRILDSRGKEYVERIRKYLGWIVFAKRPLRWREMQGAISIDVDHQEPFDTDRKLSEGPKDIFASLVELDTDGTVRLIHETAREYLERTSFVKAADVDCSLSLLSSAYLSLGEMNQNRTDEEIEQSLTSGIYAFYDYASACWATHLQAGISNSHEGAPPDLLETLESFIDTHWSATAKQLKVSQKVQGILSSIKTEADSRSPELYNKLCQAIEWSRKQLSASCVSPSDEEALGLWQVTAKIRSSLELLDPRSVPDTQLENLREFYGLNWYKCPHISCFYYHQGFPTIEKRRNHVDRHERPFLCVYDGCPTKVFGCTTEEELKKHVLNWHGYDAFDGSEYPAPAKPQRPSTAKNPATFKCPFCPDKSYTRKANLESHIRNHHEGTKDFTCTICGKIFAHDASRVRHEKEHGEKNYLCFGQLKDGLTWGCKTSFSRRDKFEGHLRSKAGQKCIRPMVIQRLQEDAANAGNMPNEELSEKADKMLAAGENLPSFSQFLSICGLDKSVIS